MESYQKRSGGKVALIVLCIILTITTFLFGYSAYNLAVELQETQTELYAYEYALKHFDSHFVIVVPDVDNFYHRPGCDRLPDEYEYLAYNVEAASGYGYRRCPDCCGDLDDYVKSHYM